MSLGAAQTQWAGRHSYPTPHPSAPTAPRFPRTYGARRPPPPFENRGSATAGQCSCLDYVVFLKGVMISSMISWTRTVHLDCLQKFLAHRQVFLLSHLTFSLWNCQDLNIMNLDLNADFLNATILNAKLSLYYFAYLLIRIWYQFSTFLNTGRYNFTIYCYSPGGDAAIWCYLREDCVISDVVQRKQVLLCGKAVLLAVLKSRYGQIQRSSRMW